MEGISLSDYLIQHSSRECIINWVEVADRISSRPCEVTGLTLFYVVMVGIRDEDGRINYDGTDDSNPIPTEIAKKIIRLGSFQLDLQQTILLNGLMNNGITTAVFKCIVDKIRSDCPNSNFIEDTLKMYTVSYRRDRWSKCKTNPLRKLWILW